MSDHSGRRLTIHIGFHKTASSTLQIAMAKACDGGRTHALYPRAGRLPDWAFAHHVLVEDLRHGHTASLDAIRAEADAAPHRPVVLSCEDFSGLHAVFTLGGLRDAFTDHTIEVVALLRGHVSWHRSHYLEQVKRGRTTLPPMAYFREHAHELAFGPVLETVRGMGLPLRILNYDTLTIPNDPFAVLMGQPMPDQPTYRENRSLAVLTTMALRQVFARPDRPATTADIIHNAYGLDARLPADQHAFDIYSQDDIDEIMRFTRPDRATVNRLSGETMLTEDRPAARGPVLPADADAELALLRALLAAPRK